MLDYMAKYDNRLMFRYELVFFLSKIHTWNQ